MRLGRLLVTAVVFGLVGPSLASAAPILIDNFELPEIEDPSGFEYRPIVSGGWLWTTGGGNVVHFEVPPYQVGNQQTIFDGNQAVQLEVTGTFIERAIPTSQGTLYNLSFLLASFVGPDQNSSTLGVSINGGALVPFAGTAAWIPQLLPFVAGVGASTTIRFENLDPVDGTFTYPHIDLIQYEDQTQSVVPEPASLVLLGAGLLGLARRRSRKSMK